MNRKNQTRRKCGQHKILNGRRWVCGRYEHSDSHHYFMAPDRAGR